MFISPGFFRSTSPSTASDALRRSQVHLTSGQRRPIAVATTAPGGHSKKKGAHQESMGESGLNVENYHSI